MRFGSAMYFPHVDGGFTRYKMVETSQCVPYPAKADERLWLCRTFSRRDSCRTSGRRVTGQAVFISGVGPIGLPDCQCCENTGAAEIVCADVSPRSFRWAKRWGGCVVNPQNDDMDHWKRKKGYFDVSFEVSVILHQWIPVWSHSCTRRNGAGRYGRRDGRIPNDDIDW